MYEISEELKMNMDHNWMVYELEYAPIEETGKIRNMDYSIIEKKSQVVHLRNLLTLRIKRVTKAKPKGWEAAVKSMTNSLEAVRNELAMRKMYGNDWANRRGGKNEK